MPGLTEHIAIPKNTTSNNGLDYHYLRDQGIKHIEELAGSLWTDYNSHDPGITILEMLCYAITDLGMRIDTPIENLIDSRDAGEGIPSQFYRAFEIFPSKPVSELDYRKLFIDLEGVKNCWLLPYEKEVFANCAADLEIEEGNLSYQASDFSVAPENIKSFVLKGLYTVLVDVDPNVERSFDEIAADIRNTYHSNRNLCEDLVTIEPVGEKRISVCAAIEVAPDADEELIKAKILHAIDQYFSPSLRFYGIKELLAKGKTTDQIFEGPLLENGFIDTDELKAAQLRNEVRVSDLIGILSAIDGVVVIKDISIGNCDGTALENDWIICLPPQLKPARCDKSAFSFFKGSLPVNINEDKVDTYLAELREEEEFQIRIASQDKRLQLPQGSPLSVSNYTTIQNDFPDTYGIGLTGIPGKVDDFRRVKAKQLKAYLLFFDTILASYFKHLSKVKDLLSVTGKESRTYFAQRVANIDGLKELVASWYPSSEDFISDQLFGNFDTDIERRNQFLDHLLARFAERFGDYVFVLKTLYGSAAEEQVLFQKETFLEEYPRLGSRKGCGFNYYKRTPDLLWNTENVSGIQHRVSRLLGIKDYSRRSLYESLIVVEEDPSESGKFIWKIKETPAALASSVLESTGNFPNRFAAGHEAFEALLQLIQTPEEAIEEALSVPVTDGTIIGNLRIRKSGGQFGFIILDDDSPAQEIAEHPESVPNRVELKNRILSCLAFAKKEFTEEGMFLVEHILLVPNVTESYSTPFMKVCTDDCEPCNLDPYSYKVTIVLPGYTYRFSNIDFRNYAEQRIREELPAHVIAKICWVGHRKDTVPDDKNDLKCFEEAWHDFLMEKSPLNFNESPSDTSVSDLLEAMNKLNTIYPVGRLLDCDDESDDTTGRIILGRTALGTINTTEDDD